MVLAASPSIMAFDTAHRLRWQAVAPTSSTTSPGCDVETRHQGGNNQHHSALYLQLPIHFTETRCNASTLVIIIDHISGQWCEHSHSDGAWARVFTSHGSELGGNGVSSNSVTLDISGAHAMLVHGNREYGIGGLAFQRLTYHGVFLSSHSFGGVPVTDDI